DDGVVNDHNHNHHDHQQLLLNDYCLTSNKIRLHCQDFFINLRNRQGCNCQLFKSSSTIRKNLIGGGIINRDDSNKLLDVSQKQQQQQQQQQQHQQFRQVVVKEEEEEEKLEEEKRFLLVTMKMMMRNPKELSSIKDHHYYLPIKMETNNQELVSSAPNNPTDSDEIDWDMWCMAQCDIGHGGSACECDIIP
ncbi:PREDICTED: protein DDB_G0268328, partial [Polistes dominula]|uniref:Protein DDB_G0268328 n=1 Tax=Polistes dominula TaxID=743375 RepID=A0ABM1I9X1_POLDO